MSWLSKAFRKYVEKPLTKALNFVGNLFGFNLTPEIPDINQRQDPRDLGAPKVGSGNYIPQFLYGQPGTYLSGTSFPINRSSSTSQKVPGNLVHSSSNGPNNKFLHLTYVLCTNKCSHVFIVDPQRNKQGTLVTDRNTNTTSRIIGSVDFEYQYFNNGYENPRDIPSWHNDKNQYPGLAIVRIRLEAPDPNKTYNPPPFSGVPEYQFHVAFAPTQESFIPDTTITDSYKNYATALYKYLTDPVNGAGLSTSLVDRQSFEDIDQYLLTFTAGPSNWDGLGHIRLRDTSIVQNIKDILFNMQCYLVFREGKFVLRPDPNYVWYVWNHSDIPNKVGFLAYPTIPSYNYRDIPTQIEPVYHTVAEDDIVGGIVFEPVTASQKYTDVELTFIDMNIEEQIRSIDPILKNRFNVNKRKNLQNTLKIQTNTTKEPGYLKEFLFTQSQKADKVQLTLLPKHLSVEPGDILTITFDAAQLAGDQFVVQTIDVAVDYTINVTAKRYLGSVARDADMRKLLASTGLTFHAYTGTSPRLLLEIPATNDVINNTQVDRFLSTPFNLEAFTDFNVSPKGNTYDVNGRSARRINITVDNLVTNNTDIEVSVLQAGKENATTITLKRTAATLVAYTSVFDTVDYDFFTGYEYRFTLRAKDIGTGVVTKTATKEIVIPGNIIIRNRNSGSRSIERTEFINDERPFGKVLNTTSKEIEDDTAVTWDDLDESTGGGANASDVALGKHTWAYYTGTDTSLDDIPWSHIGIFLANFGVVSAVQETSEVPQSGGSDVEFDLGADIDFWWTATADVTPVMTDEVFTNSFYSDVMVSAFPAFSFDVLSTDGSTLTTIPQTSDTTFVPGVTATPVATYARGRYIKPRVHVIAKGGDGAQLLGFKSYSMTVNTEELSATITGVNTGDLINSTGGGAGERTVDLSTLSPSTRFGKIRGVNITANANETKKIIGRLAFTPVDLTNSFDIEIYDIGANALADAVVDITVFGFPEVKAVLDSDGYPTDFVNNFTGEL